MPNYPGTGLAALINPNKQAFLWNAESVPTGTASIAFQLERQKSAFYPFGVSYELRFSGAPGTFQVDIQHADTDTDAAYVTMNSISAVNTNNAARVELPSCYTKYVRAKVVTLTNAVTTTMQVTR